MQKEFISYQQSLSLKELGFNEECFGEWQNLKTGKNLAIHQEEDSYVYDVSMLGANVNAPLYQQAFRWFREKPNLQSSIEATKDQHRFELGFNYFIWNTKTGDSWLTEPNDRPAGDYVFDTYEEAENACLNKLIEIVKRK